MEGRNGCRSASSSTTSAVWVGKVRVVAEGRYYRQYPVGDMISRRRHGRSSQVVEITEGVDRQVEITLPLGGAVRVEASTKKPLPESSRQRKFQVRLRGAGQLEDEVLKHLYKTHRGGSLATNTWALDEPMTSECVPAGRYHVTATLGSFPSIEKEIEIKSGAVSDLKLVFE